MSIEKRRHGNPTDAFFIVSKGTIVVAWASLRRTIVAVTWSHNPQHGVQRTIAWWK